jgi:transcription elongation factor GreA
MVSQAAQATTVSREPRLDAGTLPMTPSAYQELLDEIERSDAALAEGRARRSQEFQLQGEESGGSAEAELLLLTARLQTLNRAAATATIVNQNGPVVVGSRVTVRRSDAINDTTYELVPPGMSDVRLGRISADSAIGAALIGRKPNEEVIFQAPVGDQRLTIVDVREGS